MTDNKTWIGDFQKALEERNAPPMEPVNSTPSPQPPNISQGLADCVKRMGGTLGPKPDASDSGPTGFVSPYDNVTPECFRGRLVRLEDVNEAKSPSEDVGKTVRMALLDGSQAGVVKCVFGNGPVSISQAQITAADWPLCIIKS